MRSVLFGGYIQTVEIMFSKNSLNLNFIVFSGYKKALKTKQRTIAGKQSKCKLLSQALLQKILNKLL